MIKNISLILIFCLFSINSSFGEENKLMGPKEVEEFNKLETIEEHISDAHYWHIISWGKEHNQEISIPLPVILFDHGKLHVFLYNSFDHHTKIAKNGDSYYIYEHGVIYKCNSQGILNKDTEGKITNYKPLDFSIKRNVVSMWMSMLLIVWLFVSIARKYKKEPNKLSKLQAFMEPIILFADDIVNSQIHKSKANIFKPYLLTVFFFIWINNIIGLIPIFPGNSNVTGNISVTIILALFTFFAINIFGTKHYWKHIFVLPGVPIFIKPILIVTEIVGLFTKPFALLIRLMANISAGHVIILSLASIIYIGGLKLQMLPVSILFSIFMFILEVLVAALQAYIFTILSALFIGMAVNPAEEH